MRFRTSNAFGTSFLEKSHSGSVSRCGHTAYLSSPVMLVRSTSWNLLAVYILNNTCIVLQSSSTRYQIHKTKPGVTGQNIPPAGVYPGLKRPRLDYTRVYYSLGQFILRGILWPRLIHTPSGQIIHP